MKFLIVLVILLAIVVWLQRTVRKMLAGVTVGPLAQGSVAGQAVPNGMAARQEAVVEQMVQCAVCGIHVPDSEALSDFSGRHFCSPEHKAQAAAQ